MIEQKTLMLESGDVGRATVEEIISSVSADLEGHSSGAEHDIAILALRLNFLDGNDDNS